jgi:L-ribulokinase
MGSEPGDVYIPIPENVAAYEELFKEYRTLHDYFGRGSNDVMHRLKSIQRNANRALLPSPEAAGVPA